MVGTYSSCVEIVTPYALGECQCQFSGLFTVHYSPFTSAALYQVVIATGSHLFPFRTEKLSPPAPMVLQCNAGE